MALIVALVLLLAVTVLAISGIIMATSELRMARNQRLQERAFQAAETGLERAYESIANDEVLTTTTIAGQPEGTVAFQGRASVAPDGGEDPATNDQLEYRIIYEGTSPSGDLIVGSSAGTNLSAYHFSIESSGYAPDGAQSDHVQGFYIIGPGGT
jgi:Tfp pilus assembly protein PilX